MAIEGRLNLEAVTGWLVGSRLCGPVSYCESTGSTNDDLRALALDGAVEGTVVVAGRQTAGRGRRGRVWHGEVGRTLMFSVLLRPGLPVEQWAALGPLTGAAVAVACAELSGADVGTKWPNDVVWVGRRLAADGGSGAVQARALQSETADGGSLTPRPPLRGGEGERDDGSGGQSRKLAGLLLEAQAPEFLVIGIGINVLGDWESFPEELRGRATTLELISGRQIASEALLAAVLNALDERYGRLLAGQGDGLLAEQRRLESALGKQVVVSLGQRTVEGVVTDLGSRGELVVLTPAGEVVVSSGEVQSVRDRNGELPA